MNKKALLIVIIILASIITGIAYLLANPMDSKQAADPPAGETSTVPETGEQSNSGASGAYTEYKEGIIEQSAGTKVLFFHAPWCPQCRDLETDIKKNGVPGGVTIIKVDYDSNQNLRKKYGVTIQTTFVRVNDRGEFEKKFVAYDDPTLSSVKRNIL